MNEKTKNWIEASIELVKGWVRPIVVLVMTAIICAMTYEARIDQLTWHFWAIYGGFAGEWLGERAVKRFVEMKK